MILFSRSKRYGQRLSIKDCQTGRFPVFQVCGRIIRVLESKSKRKIHWHCFDSLMTKTRTRQTVSVLIFFYYMCQTLQLNQISSSVLLEKFAVQLYMYYMT